jgi:hypothetical protein
VEVSRWDWGAEERRVAVLASELAERVYEGAGAADLVPLVEELSGLLREDGLPASPREWLAHLDESSLWACVRGAFHRLRYHLYEEGPPVAA